MSKITIIEGFDITGKTTYIKSMKDKLIFSQYKEKFGATSTKGMYGIGYNNLWIIGALLSHLGVNKMLTEKEIVLDRGILSTLVYGKFQKGYKASNYIETYIQDIKDSNSKIIYFYHETKETAMYLFNKSRKERLNSDEYDNFSDFKNYWDQYTIFHTEFKLQIKRLQKEGVDIEMKKVKVIN